MSDLTHDPQAALAILAGAIGTLLEDKDLAYADPSEQAIVGRLAGGLLRRFDRLVLAGYALFYVIAYGVYWS